MSFFAISLSLNRHGIATATLGTVSTFNGLTQATEVGVAPSSAVMTLPGGGTVEI
jgi:hypothetical protein